MTKVAILSMPTEANGMTYHAIAGDKWSSGKTAGEALDALTVQFSDSEHGTLIILQNFQPDQFFTAKQQQRLSILMERWRTTRDQGQLLPPAEQAELDELVAAEIRASANRTNALLRELSQ